MNVSTYLGLSNIKLNTQKIPWPMQILSTSMSETICIEDSGGILDADCGAQSSIIRIHWSSITTLQYCNALADFKVDHAINC